MTIHIVFLHAGFHGLKKGQDYYGQKSEDFVSYAGSHGLKKGQDYYEQKSYDYTYCILTCRFPWPEERSRLLWTEK